MMDSYKEQAGKFYPTGRATSLTNTLPGDRETFYNHCLLHYLPPLIERTYKFHCLGPGFFAMEASEYKNVTSKQEIMNHSNRKVNVCKQSLK